MMHQEEPNVLLPLQRFPHELSPIFTPLTPADLDDVMALEVQSFPTPWSRSTYQRELQGNRIGSYWAVRPGPGVQEAPPILAYGGLWCLGEEGHIATIATHPQWRRRKLGTWLLLNMLTVARVSGARLATLEVRVSNRGAIALYNSLGFVQVGRRRRYYHDNGEDALLMTLFDLDHPDVWRRLEALREEIARKPDERAESGEPIRRP
ncbi:ribosomal protein S18-alanine N-acetyltransferase [Litorilinea aerophila]|uniref:Ribosomal-protein-alanine N-acetyltransferase n=1 Tax=Litorilinea aerophila TaxID=1204385 RepID=A0A540VEP1_9CHLR|nr:ribosomal protein S18-alanine N-acetyltransferase [Litorilinea aerophila]MCC9077130.1 ribosomal protein S18-alanine N-acetyltransferase [Litorilinea aerophila]GIV76126.1 MAG: hypothetical protein KatS3mg050_0520 [Litorilinea sp.]